MAAKAQLKHALVDVDFLDKPKVVALMGRYGDVSALYLLNIIFALSRATEACMDIYAAYGLGKRYGFSLDRAREVVTYCIKEKMLSVDGELLSQERVRVDQEKLAKKREEDRIYQADRRNRLGTDKPPDIVPDSVPDPVFVSVTDTALESGVKEKGGVGEKTIGEKTFDLDTLSIKLRSSGIKFEGCAERAIELAQGQYKTPSPTIWQLTKGWVYQELLKEQAARLNAEAAEIRLSNAKNGYQAPKESPEEKAARRKRFLERDDATA